MRSPIVDIKQGNANCDMRAELSALVADNRNQSVKTIVSCRLSEKQINFLKNFASQHNTSVSRIISSMINYFDDNSK
jgi:hypothetical protein